MPYHKTHLQIGDKMPYPVNKGLYTNLAEKNSSDGMTFIHDI